MEAPCQKIVWEVLPAIKAAIAAELVRSGITQAEAARMLSMAPSAVSQYLSGKRGYRMTFEDEVKISIELLARDLIDKKPVSLVTRTCDICRLMQGSDSVCERLPDECSGK
ncbi:MAG: transcriptional regulator [Methanomicrobiales archaeon HGW-Methanomicrobiales-3]|nr:MAG: transcriptional regulator [Methanomicrobiales archaeon HGW-Methanomicrobiales-3]